jgi:hypothetical protein
MGVELGHGARHHATMRKTVAAGAWFYDGEVPRHLEITAKPAEFAGSRFDDEERLDPSTPVLEAVEGLLYEVGATAGGEFSSLAEAKAWADAQPWGPVLWDD